MRAVKEGVQRHSCYLFYSHMILLFILQSHDRDHDHTVFSELVLTGASVQALQVTFMEGYIPTAALDTKSREAKSSPL